MNMLRQNEEEEFWCTHPDILGDNFVLCPNKYLEFR